MIYADRTMHLQYVPDGVDDNIISKICIKRKFDDYIFQQNKALTVFPDGNNNDKRRIIEINHTEKKRYYDDMLKMSIGGDKEALLKATD